MGFRELRRELPVAPLFRLLSLNRSDKGRAFLSLSMADAHGDDLAESLQSLFTNVSSMVKSELQMNVRVAAEYDDLGDVAALMKLKSGGFDEFVGQMDAIEKQVSEFEAVVDRYVSVLESKIRA
ncbi:hypothetical protein F2Q68_00036576 [Brassica cretica]|nr:hypothetical protein F2Q68_00036576 [Brassica cretica]